MAKEVGDQDDVKIQVRTNQRNAPVDEGGGAVLVHTDVRAVLTMNDGGPISHIQAPAADSGGDGPINTEGGGHVGVQDQVDDGVLRRSLSEWPTLSNLAIRTLVLRDTGTTMRSLYYRTPSTT